MRMPMNKLKNGLILNDSERRALLVRLFFTLLLLAAVLKIGS